MEQNNVDDLIKATDLRAKVLRGESVSKEELRAVLDSLREGRISAKDSGARKKKASTPIDITSLMEDF